MIKFQRIALKAAENQNKGSIWYENESEITMAKEAKETEEEREQTHSFFVLLF